MFNKQKIFYNAPHIFCEDEILARNFNKGNILAKHFKI